MANFAPVTHPSSAKPAADGPRSPDFMPIPKLNGFSSEPRKGYSFEAEPIESHPARAKSRVISKVGSLIRPSAVAAPPPPCFASFATRSIRICARDVCLLKAKDGPCLPSACGTPVSVHLTASATKARPLLGLGNGTPNRRPPIRILGRVLSQGRLGGLHDPVLLFARP